MQKKLRYFGLIYWAIFCIVILGAWYREGRAELDRCIKVKGLVVDQVMVRIPNEDDVPRPQIRYTAYDSVLYFVDHNTALSVGRTPDILYRKDNPSQAQIYNLFFWYDDTILVPSFLACALVFAVIRILYDKSSNDPVTLPGE